MKVRDFTDSKPQQKDQLYIDWPTKGEANERITVKVGRATFYVRPDGNGGLEIHAPGKRLTVNPEGAGTIRVRTER